MIFDKCTKTIQWGKNSLFNKWCWDKCAGKFEYPQQKNEVGPLPHTNTKSNSKWIKDLNIRADNIKLLEENIGLNLHDLVFSDGFLDMTPKAQATKKK